MKAPKSLKDIEQELGGLGTEYSLPVKFAGLVDFGKEIQLELPDGLLTYLPMDTFVKAVDL
jgi:hypothetical protein